MALGTLAEHPGTGLTIVPCGMNYFHAHKFRSRAVVEFGPPIEVQQQYIDKYKSGDRRSAVSGLLDDIQKALVGVTVNAPDYETLMVSNKYISLQILTITLARSSCSTTL
jgi:glycerol-3-phosphate O-acyltransferase/dihydroxyacetone phosphate acyltransferase